VAFFSHPLATQRFLIAQQIASTMSGDDQEQARLLILRELLNSEDAQKNPAAKADRLAKYADSTAEAQN
jgi:hypothetical protein